MRQDAACTLASISAVLRHLQPFLAVGPHSGPVHQTRFGREDDFFVRLDALDDLHKIVVHESDLDRLQLRAAIAIRSEIRGAYYQLGFALFQTGDFVEAGRAFARELDFQPPDSHSLYYLARIRLLSSQPREAIAFFEKSLEAGEVLDVRRRLASGYLGQGQIDRAIPFLEESIRVRPEDGDLHYLLGRAYQQKGKVAAAQLEFDAARRWQGKARTEMQALTRLQQALVENSQADVLAVTRELENSRDPDVLLAAATTLGRAGLHQEAVSFLEKSIGLQPNLVEAHYNLARALIALHEMERAQQELRVSVELRPDFYEAEALLGTLLADSGQSENAIPHLRAAVQLRSDSPRLIMLLGLQYFEQRYYQDAIELLEKCVRLDPGNPEPLFLLIQAHYRNLEYEPALKLAQETLKMFPDNPMAHFHVGAQLNNFSRLPEAKAELEETLAKDPKLLEARVMLGDVLFKMGEPQDSLLQLRQALSDDPKLMDAYSGIGKALIQLKRYPETSVAMQQAIQIDDKVPSPHLYLSQAYRALGRTEDAKKEAEVFGRLNAERAKSRDKDVERKYR